MTIWLTSDTHFGHANILRLAERPFADVDEMQRALLAEINARVAPGDDLYILGDFSFKMTVDAAREVRRKIRCERVHLVPGNHDKDWSQPAVAGTFIVEPPICKVKLEGGKRLIMSHYPLLEWQGMAHDTVHLHGHIHATRVYNEANRERGWRRYDVGVDANGYRPVSVEEVLAFFEGVEPRAYFDWRAWASGDATAE